jgi:hypothetical protein
MELSRSRPELELDMHVMQFKPLRAAQRLGPVGA